MIRSQPRVRHAFGQRDVHGDADQPLAGLNVLGGVRAGSRQRALDAEEVEENRKDRLAVAL